MIRLDITVPDITEIMTAGYDLIRVYTDASEDGGFSTLDGTIELVLGISGYSYIDVDGTTSTWYKTSYFDESSVVDESDKSAAQQGGTIDAYCTALDVRKELASSSGKQAIGREYEDILWNMCVEASRMIDRFKRVEDNAYMASGSEIRYFHSRGGVRQRIDYVTSITEVAVEQTDGVYTVWAPTDYFTWPYSDDEPIMRLDINPKSSGSKSIWTPGPKRVKVTGVWGISTSTPDIIARCCKILVARWFKRAQQGWQDTGGQAEMGELSYTKGMDPEVKILLSLAYPRRIRL